MTRSLYGTVPHVWPLVPIALIALTVGGCGGDGKLGLQGTVTYQDVPIEKGRIDFLPTDGTTGPSVGSPIVKGTYTVAANQGVLATGTYQVCVTSYQKTGRTEANQIDRGGPPVEVEENVIPPIYNAQSAVKLRVADLADKTKADFHLGGKSDAAAK